MVLKKSGRLVVRICRKDGGFGGFKYWRMPSGEFLRGVIENHTFTFQVLNSLSDSC